MAYPKETLDDVRTYFVPHHHHVGDPLDSSPYLWFEVESPTSDYALLYR